MFCKRLAPRESGEVREDYLAQPERKPLQGAPLRRALPLHTVKTALRCRVPVNPLICSPLVSTKTQAEIRSVQAAPPSHLDIR
jgi:hypothetical protein